MRYFLFVMALLVLSGCSVPDPAGDLITFEEGEQIEITFEDRPDEIHFMNVEGLGPKGVMLRGVTKILQVGDPVQRQVGNKLYELGIVKEINLGNRTVTILVYDTYKVVE